MHDRREILRRLIDAHDAARDAMADLMNGIAREAPGFEGRADLQAECDTALAALSDSIAAGLAAEIEIATGQPVRLLFPERKAS